jgi:hypothetical protein
MQDTAAKGGRFLTVGGHDDRRTVFPVKSLQEGKNDVPRPVVEGTGRFVRQDETGTMDERPCQSNPLLLPAGELRGGPVFHSGETDLFQKTMDGKRIASSLESQGKKDVFAHGEGREQVEELKDESHILPAKEGSLPFRETVQGKLSEKDCPLIRQIDAANQVQECGLARAGIPHQDNPFPSPDRKKGNMEGRSLFSPSFSIPFPDTVQTDPESDGRCFLPKQVFDHFGKIRSRKYS